MTCIQPIWAKKEYIVRASLTEKGTPIVPGTIKLKFKGSGKRDFPVKCGKCLGCKLDHATDTATRCWMETQEHEKNSFITLTYDQKHLPIGDKGFPTLKKSDVQGFIKRLRRHLEYHYGLKNIRYIQSGEYGPKTLRPHYHLALFGYKPNDLKKWDENEQGDSRFTSEEIQKIWGKGRVIIGELTQQSGSYIARYVTKKLLEPEKIIPGCIEEYIIFSKCPAVGLTNWQKYKNKYIEQGGIYIKVKDKVRLFPIPDLFQKKRKIEVMEKYGIWNKKEFEEIIKLADKEKKPYKNNQLLCSILEYIQKNADNIIKERYYQDKFKSVEMAQKRIDEILKQTDLTYENYLKLIKNKLETNNQKLKRTQI